MAADYKLPPSRPVTAECADLLSRILTQVKGVHLLELSVSHGLTPASSFCLGRLGFGFLSMHRSQEKSRGGCVTGVALPACLTGCCLHLCSVPMTASACRASSNTPGTSRTYLFRLRRTSMGSTLSRHWPPRCALFRTQAFCLAWILALHSLCGSCCISTQHCVTSRQFLGVQAKLPVRVQACKSW